MESIKSLKTFKVAIFGVGFVGSKRKTVSSFYEKIRAGTKQARV